MKPVRILDPHKEITSARHGKNKDKYKFCCFPHPAALKISYYLEQR